MKGRGATGDAVRRVLVAGSLALLAGCAHVAPAGPRTAPALTLIGSWQLPADRAFGGISGIDYDARHGDWVLVTDDRCEHGPARFWRMRIAYGAGGIASVDVGAPQAWRQPDGSTYAARGAASAGVVADIESVRVDPHDGTLWYGSEGDRDTNVPSFVRNAAADGGYLAELPLPENLRIRSGCACGGRGNAGPEGLAFTPDGGALWVAMEGPLLEDGAPPTLAHGAPARITLLSRQGAVLARHAYPLDPVPAAGDSGGPADNGIAEILALDARRLLVLERSGRRSGNGFAFDTRLYVVDVGGAPLAKHAVAGYAPPPGWQDNYEAMAWGPRLPDGRRTLVLASDNNFSGAPTRLLVFALVNAED